MTAAADLDEVLAVGRLNWLETRHGRVLHSAREWTAGLLEELADGGHSPGPVRLACGQVARAVWIPGVFTRLGAPRCARCCKATGLPPGKGSPNNDPACRNALGLPLA